MLEPSKRKGNDECLEVKLPHSQESLSVPNNFYYAKINVMLNKNEMLESRMLNEEQLREFVVSEKKVWKITDSRNWNTKTFKQVIIKILI